MYIYIYCFFSSRDRAANHRIPLTWHPEVGICKIKPESKKNEREYALEQESAQENDQEKRKSIDEKISFNFTFICRFDQIEYIFMLNVYF